MNICVWFSKYLLLTFTSWDLSDRAEGRRPLVLNRQQRTWELNETWLYIYMYICIYTYMGTAVAQWLRCCARNRKVADSIAASVSGFFIDIKSFRSHYGPGVDSASNRNEYQEHFLEGKGGWCVRLTTLPPSCAVVMKSGNLNFLEPSGSLQACNATALCFTCFIRAKFIFSI
jgi:hypothetical protein